MAMIGPLFAKGVLEAITAQAPGELRVWVCEHQRDGDGHRPDLLQLVAAENASQVLVIMGPRFQREYGTLAHMRRATQKDRQLALELGVSPPEGIYKD